MYVRRNCNCSVYIIYLCPINVLIFFWLQFYLFLWRHFTTQNSFTVIDAFKHVYDSYFVLSPGKNLWVMQKWNISHDKLLKCLWVKIRARTLQSLVFLPASTLATVVFWHVHVYFRINFDTCIRACRPLLIFLFSVIFCVYFLWGFSRIFSL